MITDDQKIKEYEKLMIKQLIKKVLQTGVKKGLITQEQAEYLADTDPEILRLLKKEVMKNDPVPISNNRE